MATTQDKKLEAMVLDLDTEMQKVWRKMEALKKECDTGSLKSATKARIASASMAEMMRITDQFPPRYLKKLLN